MQCKFEKDGKPCGASAMRGSDYCFFHSPEHEKERQEAQSQGGRSNAVTVINPLPAVEIKAPRDVVNLLEGTINQVRAGELDVKIGNCIGVLSGHLIKALELVSVASRVDVIERAILERRTTI